MRLVFISPFQAEADLIDHGIHMVRGEPFTVSDALGAELLKHKTLYVEHKPDAPAAPAKPAPDPVKAEFQANPR